MGLLLRAVDVAGPLRWRWLLTDAETGAPLADHEVDLAPEPDAVARFRDLYAYTRQFAVPDRRVSDGARIIAEAGDWAGQTLLGGAVGAAIKAAARTEPVTVLVTAQPPADQVLRWPLEVAHVDGRPLAADGDVAFVYDIAEGMPAAGATAGTQTGFQAVAHAAGPAAGSAARSGPLRILAVFSQPTRTSVLALRRERYALSRLIRRLASRERAAVELRVIQYGVTRQRLAEIAGDGDGWDVLHLSGHGAGGAFLLEKPDGAMDLVPAQDLVRLLRPARQRVKLAVLSACQSAADATAETYRLLGLTEQAEALEASAPGPGPAETEIPGLARTLVRELGCPVVGMRYPVTDSFAIAFGGTLYERLLSRRQPVDLAVASAIAVAAGPAATPACPATSLATPGLFGAGAVGQRIVVPRGRPVMDPAEQKMAFFPAEPARFVGRAEPMAKASAALATDSRRTGVLLHGMAGAGKTACALELAYRHQDSFAALAFWQAPTRDDEWETALPDLASRLDIQLADYGFTMASHITTEAALRAFLPRLRSVMADAGVLLVLDNLETLLTAAGTWRDPRLDLVLDALLGHDGESRVILTSRIAPRGRTAPELTQGPAARVVALPVHALSLGESAALARELPNLRALLHADPGPDRPPPTARGLGEAQAEVQAEADRDRVRRVLRVVQGHPKLMELADAAAADRDRLDAQLAEAEAQAEAARTCEQPSAGDPLGTFFRTGESPLDPAEFLATLTAWTISALAVLPPEARLMAEFLACLEDGDRRSDVVAANWANLWRRLRRPGDPPDSGTQLAVLASAALVEAERVPAAEPRGESGAADSPGIGQARLDLVILRMHPGVAAAITAAAAPGVREAADAELAGFWRAVLGWARGREGGEDSALVVQAGLAGAPYLLRRGDWNTARFLLEEVTVRDESPGVTQTVLPPLRRIAAATREPAAAGVLANVLMRVDPAEAERLLRGAHNAAAGTGDHRGASVTAGQLFNLLADAGRLGEALALAEQLPELTRRAGLGPWTQLADEGQRLQVLGLMGEHARVVAEVDRLRAVMAALPSHRDPSEAVDPWNVREVILTTGHTSALAVGEWTRCLELNAEAAASKRERGAGEHEVTRTLFNDAPPLIRLGRLAEAGRLLAECQRVFEDHADTASLAVVLSARADLEFRAAHWQAAADLERAALRLRYTRPGPEGIAIGHHNLAIYLGLVGEDRRGQRAHRLAAALIRQLAGMTHSLAGTVRALAAEMRADGGTDPSLPSTVAQVTALTDQTEGVRLAALLAASQPDTAQLEEALTEVLRAAAALAVAPAADAQETQANPAADAQEARAQPWQP